VAVSETVERALVSSMRLLIIEDDRRYARGLAELIGQSLSDIDATVVATLQDARQVLLRGDVDLVIADLGLPDSDGMTTLDRISEFAENVPIVVLTGRSDEELALLALQRGVQDYLVKDAIDQRSLVRSIRYALQRHSGIRELARMTRELQAANSALEKLTLLDPLTGLLNRRGLQQALSREVTRLEREDADVLVLVLDLDDFKRINEAFGHAVGDVALQEAAHRIRACSRSLDYACRIGGDEFLLLLPDAKRSEVARIAERARAAISSMVIQHSTGPIRLTASIAAMLLRRDTPSIDEILTRGHQLLQRCKRQGKNRVVYEAGTFEDTAERRRKQTDLCANLSEGKFLRTVKQPIFRLADEAQVGFEFLSRYSNGVTEMPDNFFRICAERNVLTLVDHHCMKAALRTARALQQKSRFHINLFPSTLLAIPTEHLLSSFPQPIPQDTYCVEISEQQIIGDPSYLREPVAALRSAGLLVAIDDVGFGNSCLESLMLLEPEIIKIDKRCITGIARDRSRTDSLRRYVDLARTLHAGLIAEGVESRDDFCAVQDAGVEYAQGFLWGRPA
jgi:diguanylate cyclase (GGDEF)-like protein